MALPVMLTSTLHLMVLLFAHAFGDVMSAGIGGGSADRSECMASLVSGIPMVTIGRTEGRRTRPGPDGIGPPMDYP